MLRGLCGSLLILGTAVAIACSPSSEEDAGSTASNGTGSTTTSVGTANGSTGAFGNGCAVACVAPQFCSVNGMCVDEGTCFGDGDCGAGFKCDLAQNICVPGGDCGSFEAEIAPVPPNLLVVLDRSCSMTDTVGGGMTKWDVAVAALNNLTTTYAGQIRFGLTLFPDLEMPPCGQGAVAIPPGPGNEMAVSTLLTNALAPGDMYFPDGPCVTNIDTAVEQASMEPALMDATRDNYAILITDGQQSGCNLAGGDMGTESILAQMFAANVPTFVLGFGSGVDPNQMNAFAVAGGVPRMGMPQYYDASDQASLDMALAIIAESTIGCDFVLTDTPPNADDIFVFFDGQSVVRDPGHASGWDYDPATNTITFYGASCEDVKGGVVMDVDVVFGCNKPPV